MGNITGDSSPICNVFAAKSMIAACFDKNSAPNIPGTDRLWTTINVCEIVKVVEKLTEIVTCPTTSRVGHLLPLYPFEKALA